MNCERSEKELLREEIKLITRQGFNDLQKTSREKDYDFMSESYRTTSEIIRQNNNLEGYNKNTLYLTISLFQGNRFINNPSQPNFLSGKGVSVLDAAGKMGFLGNKWPDLEPYLELGADYTGLDLNVDKYDKASIPSFNNDYPEQKINFVESDLHDVAKTFQPGSFSLINCMNFFGGPSSIAARQARIPIDKYCHEILDQFDELLIPGGIIIIGSGDAGIFIRSGINSFIAEKKDRYRSMRLDAVALDYNIFRKE